MKKLILTAVFAAAAFGVQAQMGTPIPKEVEGCKFMLGVWEADMTMAFMGQESKGKAKVVNSMAVGGRFLRGDHQYEVPGMGTNHGMQMLTYDGGKKKWVSQWFDSTDAGFMEMEGDWVGNTMTLTSKPTPMAGSDQAMIMRAIYKKIDDKTMEFRLEMKQGDQFAPMMWGTYKKVK